ncbi:MAG: sigma-54-dependent Fis family transcriptional regulator [Candidatus Latescibacterota bacterium]
MVDERAGPAASREGELEVLRCRVAVLEEAALQRGQAEDVLETRSRILEAFQEVTRLVLSPVSLAESLDVLARQIVDAGIFRSLMIALVDETTHSVEVMRSFVRRVEEGQSTRGRVMDRDPSVGGTRYDLDDPNVTAVVARTGKLEIIEGWDPRFDRRFNQDPGSMGDQVSYFIPVKQAGRVLAVLATGSTRAERPTITRRIQTMQPLLDQAAMALERAQLHLDAWRQAVRDGSVGGELIGQSPALQRVRRHLAQVAGTDVNALLLGETGTGKGLAARTLHDLSARCDGPFIQVNCGAIPHGLVESELFGHERGAFTGAVSRRLGKVELARGGTLLLDEIGDLAPDSQVKLLRLLEERAFERVGGTETLRSAARIISATNRDLRRMVTTGAFREDLYYRLQAFSLVLPPLRERREDIRLLALYFMGRTAGHLDKAVTHLTPEALRAMQAYPWPGNVRELEHAVRRGVIMATGTALDAGDLGLDGPAEAAAHGNGRPSPAEYERQYLRHALEQSDWVIKGPRGAAIRLGMSPATLRRRIAKLGIGVEVGAASAPGTGTGA